jgi:diguanylate cyclase (GGDEF)-like protein
MPVIGGGRVIGIVLLVRPDDTPFAATDEAVIGQLAPMVGSAMTAAELHGDVAELSRTDALTGLGNRRSLDTDLDAALRAGADDRRIGFIMIDVDHFKHFNDTNGHSAGDDALSAIAGVLRANVRIGDAAYRYGGEEFALLLRDVDETQVREVAERVRAAVAALDIAGAERQPGGRLTVSLGVVIAPGGDVDPVVAAADAALYAAKDQGRDRVVVAAAGVRAA